MVHQDNLAEEAFKDL